MHAFIEAVLMHAQFICTPIDASLLKVPIFFPLKIPYILPVIM